MRKINVELIILAIVCIIILATSLVMFLDYTSEDRCIKDGGTMLDGECNYPTGSSESDWHSTIKDQIIEGTY